MLAEPRLSGIPDTNVIDILFVAARVWPKRTSGRCASTCGSQILAEVLGGKVYPHDKKGIGFFPIYKTEATMQEASLALMPASWTVFHWHGDTFDLPPGAVHLFFSDACSQQGFKKGKCFGFQFHGEVNDELLHSMIHHERNKLIKGDYVQTETEILSYTVINENIQYFNNFLDGITQ